MKFAGEYLDPIGLYHLRARDYDPATGRPIRPDPVDATVDSPLISAYAYVANRPKCRRPSGATFEPSAEWQARLGAAVSPEHVLEPWPPFVPGRFWPRCAARLGYPLGVIGGFNGGPAAHRNKPPYNWQSDNAIDLNVPVRTRVCAVFKGRVSATLGFVHRARVSGCTSSVLEIPPSTSISPRSSSGRINPSSVGNRSVSQAAEASAYLISTSHSFAAIRCAGRLHIAGL